MKWYDYLYCVIAADFITAGIFGLDIFLFTFGVFGYIMYEKASVMEMKRKK